jgi:Arc-like DNA binding domain
LKNDRERIIMVRMRQKTPNSDQIIVRMPSELRGEIERKASEEGRSLSSMTRRIVERWLAEHRAAA